MWTYVIFSLERDGASAAGDGESQAVFVASQSRRDRLSVNLHLLMREGGVEEEGDD